MEIGSPVRSLPQRFRQEDGSMYSDGMNKKKQTSKNKKGKKIQDMFWRQRQNLIDQM